LRMSNFVTETGPAGLIYS